METGLTFQKIFFLKFMSTWNCTQIKTFYSLYFHMWKIIFLMCACKKKHAEVLILMFAKLYPILMALLMRSFSASAMN